jgi:hypothetical protein
MIVKLTREEKRKAVEIADTLTMPCSQLKEAARGEGDYPDATDMVNLATDLEYMLNEADRRSLERVRN